MSIIIILVVIRARQEQLERQAEIQRKKEEEIQRKLEEKNKSLSSSTAMSSSWRNADKAKEDSKLFGSNRGEKDRREVGGFGRSRDDGAPRSIFSSRVNDSKSGSTFGARDDRGGWNRGSGGANSSSGGLFDKGFKEGGPRDGGVRSAFDRDTPRKPPSNDQVNGFAMNLIFYTTIIFLLSFQ